MRPHNLDTYREGWLRIEFCTICGAEGQQLFETCKEVTKKDDTQFELFSCFTGKKIDRKSEQS
jgi:hypothetical protein